MKKLTGTVLTAAFCLLLTSVGIASIMWSTDNVKPVVSLRYEDPVTHNSVLRNFSSTGDNYVEFHRDNDGNLYMSVTAENESGMSITAYGVGSGVARKKGGTDALLCWQDNLPLPEIVFADNVEMLPETVYMTGYYAYDSSNSGKCSITVYAAGNLDLYGATTPARMTLKVKAEDMPPELSPYDIIDRDLIP